MTLEIVAINAVDEESLPFSPGAALVEEVIEVYSQPDAEAIAEGETELFGWFDLRDVPDELERLIEPGEIVLKAPEAILVLVYPLSVAAVCVIRTERAEGFKRRDLISLIAESYREIYKAEEQTQSEPTPPISERGHIINRPKSDGTFGVWGHDFNDLGVSAIEVHRIDGKIWLDLAIES